jgi:methyl-accepting chemotaxis protein
MGGSSVRNSKKTNILFCAASLLVTILAQVIFTYFQIKSMLGDLGYSLADNSLKVLFTSLNSALLGIFIEAILIAIFVIYSKKLSKDYFMQYARKSNETSPIKNKDGILELYRNIADNSEEIGASMYELSNFTDSQAANIEQFSAALEEISSGVQQTSENTQNASDFVMTVQDTVSVLVESIEEVASAARALTDESESAKAAVKDGEKIVTDAINEMNNVSMRIKDLASSIAVLGESTEKIGKIIDVINSITDQTNMLGLNASIEAARAGEYGRGFAVVARSIKELSDKSKEATDSISGIIRNIQECIKEAVDKSNIGLVELEEGMSLVKASGESIGKILYVVDKTYEYSTVVTESTKLQEESSKEIIDSVSELSGIIQDVSATTIEEAASIEQVVAGVEIIKESIDELVAGTQELTSFSNAVAGDSRKLIEAYEK